VFVPLSGGKATVRVSSHPSPAFGLQAAQQTSHFGLSGVQALRGEHPSIERELATIGDRGTATAAFDEPNWSMSPGRFPGRSGRETASLFLHEADEPSCVVNRVPAVLRVRAVHGLAMKDDLEIELPVARSRARGRPRAR